MLVVLYQFKIKEGCQEVFEKSWSVVTDAIKRARGSLGSRLHTTEDIHTYIAYAQWPSLEVLEGGIGSDLFSIEEQEALKTMKETFEKVDVLHRMKVLDDRLVA